MRASVWVVSEELEREAVEQLLGELSTRGANGTTRKTPSGRVIVIPDAPPGLEVPESVVRVSDVRAPGDGELVRRGLLDGLAWAVTVATVVAVLAVVALFSRPTADRTEPLDPIEVARFDELEREGMRRFRFGTWSCVAVWSNEKIHALSAECSHLGGLVDWDAETRRLHCTWCGSLYDVGGNVLSGPAAKPLESLDVLVKGDRILVRERTRP